MTFARTATLTVCSLAAAAGAFAFAARQDMPMPTPTDQHRELLRGVGEWEGTLTHFTMNPQGTTIPATQTVEAIGGFWTQTTFECEFMGMPYVGTGCMGYDPDGGKYVGTWIDNMSSMLAIMEGEKDEQTGAIVMRWEAPHPVTMETATHTSEMVETEDSHVSTFYVEDGDGERTKTMVIELKKEGAEGEAEEDEGAGG